MAKNIYGGGSQTNVNGLNFEQETDLSSSFLNLPHSKVINDIVSINNVQVGRLLGKNKLYKNLLEPAGVDYKSIISKKLLPDEAFLYKLLRLYT